MYRISIEASVGAQAVNNPSDVEIVVRRLKDLGFPVPAAPTGEDEETVHAIRLFQAAKNGLEKLTFPKNDGRVDKEGDTIDWLNARNAPRWQELPPGSEDAGYVNFEVATAIWDIFDYGTSWLAQTIEDAGAHYLKNYLKTHKAAPITVNDASLKKGGLAVGTKGKVEHKGHQSGMSADLRLPRTDGTAPGETKTNVPATKYDRNAMRAMLRAFHAQPLFKLAYLNDDVLIKEKLCKFQAKHYDHAHIEINAPAREDIVLLEVFGQCVNHTDDSLAVYGPRRSSDPNPGEFSLYRLPPHRQTPKGHSYEGVLVPAGRTAAQWKYIDFLFADHAGPVAVRYGAGMRFEVSARGADEYALPIEQRGIFEPGGSPDWFVPAWAHDGPEIASLPEVPDVELAQSVTFGRCINFTDGPLGVYGPKDVGDPTMPNKLYWLTQGRMTPRYWDCDGIFVPNDMKAVTPDTPLFEGEVAVKYRNFSVVNAYQDGDTYVLPSEAAVFQPGNAHNWTVPDIPLAELKDHSTELLEHEPPIPSGHGRCVNRTNDTLFVYGPRHSGDDDSEFTSLYRLPKGEETPDNWGFVGLYIPKDKIARRVGAPDIPGTVPGSVAVVFPPFGNTIIEEFNNKYTLPPDFNVYRANETCSARGVPASFLAWPNYGWPFCIQWPIPDHTYEQALNQANIRPVPDSVEIGTPRRRRSGIERIDKIYFGEAVGGEATIGFADADREAVGALQTLLRGHGASDLPNQRQGTFGRYGPLTQRYIRKFCQSHKIKCDPKNPVVDRVVLKRLIEEPMPTPVFGRVYATLGLGRKWDAWHKILELVGLFECRGEFGFMNPNEDDQGLSYGLIHWAQRQERLQELLTVFADKQPVLFESVFRGKTLATGMLAHTKKPDGGTKPDGTSTDPKFELTDDVWKKAFCRAAREARFQSLQIDTAITHFRVDLYKLVTARMPRIKSERGVTFAIDLVNQHGPDGGPDIYDSVANSALSGTSEPQLLEAMANKSVAEVSAKFRKSTRTRRDWFRTTSHLSETPFVDLLKDTPEDHD